MVRLYLFAEGQTEQTFADTVLKPHLAALQTIVDARITPELINDGPHSAPSKRIIAEFPDYKRAKSVEGPQMAELIGLDVIRNKCPHFAAWLSQLEKLERQIALA